jgi:hypothetical protein
VDEKKNVPIPQIGDIWVELDPRATVQRTIRIDRIACGSACVRTVRRAVHNADWVNDPSSRECWAKLTRFNGKRNGYALHLTAAQVRLGIVRPPA